MADPTFDFDRTVQNILPDTYMMSLQLHGAGKFEKGKEKFELNARGQVDGLWQIKDSDHYAGIGLILGAAMDPREGYNPRSFITQVGVGPRYYLDRHGFEIGAKLGFQRDDKLELTPQDDHNDATRDWSSQTRPWMQLEAGFTPVDRFPLQLAAGAQCAWGSGGTQWMFTAGLGLQLFKRPRSRTEESPHS